MRDGTVRDLLDAADRLARTLRQRRADRRLRRRIRDVQRWRIGELPEDTLGRLSGTVRPCGPVLEAPLSGRTCVY